ncbi:hypothetical protein ACHAWC_009291 [Mediolabrus comicus]
MISKLVPIALLLLLSLLNGANGFHIVLAGGTGQIGRELSSKLVSDGHEITILCRNAFLAAAPSRVSSDFEQREMATERIVREALRVNPTALQITVAPLDEELKMFSNVAVGAKIMRLKLCEEQTPRNKPHMTKCAVQ